MGAVGAGTQIIGGEMQGWAALLAKWKMADALQKAYNVQAQHRGEAMRTVLPAIKGSGREQATKDMTEGAAHRTAGYEAAAGVPSSFDKRGGASETDKAQGRMRGQSRAKLGAYNDWSLNQMLRDIKLGNTLNQISSFAGGDASLVPYDMYEAQHKYDWLSQIGQAISSIGGGATDMAKFSQMPQGGAMPGGGGGGGGFDMQSFGPVSQQGFDYSPSLNGQASSIFDSIA